MLRGLKTNSCQRVKINVTKHAHKNSKRRVPTNWKTVTIIKLSSEEESRKARKLLKKIILFIH